MAGLDGVGTGGRTGGMVVFRASWGDGPGKREKNRGIREDPIDDRRGQGSPGDGSAESCAIRQRVGGEAESRTVSHWENGGDGARFLRSLS